MTTPQPPQPPDPDQIESFYRAATLGLAALEARAGTPRRFGPDADARWNAFRGALQDWHRLDLLVRDAAVAHAAGFAPRVVFALPALADDEPFGPDWPGPAPTIAGDLLRQGAAATHTDLAALLDELARIWHLEPAAVPAAATAGIEPATRLACAGAGAVLAVARAFHGRPELDLADQVILVADDPGTRQLFGLAIAALGSPRAGGQRPVHILDTTPAPDTTRIDRAIASPDARPAARDALARLAEACGAPLVG